MYGEDSSNFSEEPSSQQDEEDKEQQPDYETFVVAAPPAVSIVFCDHHTYFIHFFKGNSVARPSA